MAEYNDRFRVEKVGYNNVILINVDIEEEKGWCDECHTHVDNLSTAHYLKRCLRDKRLPTARSKRRLHYLYSRILRVCRDTQYCRVIRKKKEKQKYINIQKGRVK